MIYEERNKELKYPRAIKDEKTRLVLDWLLEFRFSSIEVLSARIGQIPSNANRFFNSLLNDKIIQSFKNAHTKNYRFFMLASAGVGYLEAEGRNIEKAVTKVATLGRYSHIIHDLSVQYIVLNRMQSWEEVVWDKNINFGDDSDRPDVLLKYHKGEKTFWSAIEYERWRKDSKRIFLTFYNHVKNIQNKRYVGVTYLFQQEADAAHYQKLFKTEDWPIYERSGVSGKIRKTGDIFNPDNIENIRKRFVFKYEPVEI